MPGASTSNGQIMTLLKGNISGQVQQIPAVTINGARERCIIETIPLTAQAIASRIAIARIPLYAVVLGIFVIQYAAPTAATLSFGDFNADAKFGAAAVVAAINA